MRGVFAYLAVLGSAAIARTMLCIGLAFGGYWSFGTRGFCCADFGLTGSAPLRHLPILQRMGPRSILTNWKNMRPLAFAIRVQGNLIAGPFASEAERSRSFLRQGSLWMRAKRWFPRSLRAPASVCSPHSSLRPMWHAANSSQCCLHLPSSETISQRSGLRADGRALPCALSWNFWRRSQVSINDPKQRPHDHCVLLVARLTHGSQQRPAPKRRL